MTNASRPAFDSNGRLLGDLRIQVNVYEDEGIMCIAVVDKDWRGEVRTEAGTMKLDEVGKMLHVIEDRLMRQAQRRLPI